MKKKTLGKSPLQLPPLAFGGNVFGWTVDEAGTFKLMDALVDCGLNFIDTADVYSRWVEGNVGGESETLIGKWIKKSGKRDKIILATKAGIEMGPGKKGLGRAYLLSAIDDSLRRLQTDYVDLYQSHRDDSETPLEETLSAFDEIVKQGKARAIGASNYSAERFESALRVSEQKGLPRYESLQPCYNLYDRQEYEKNLEPVCVEHEVGVISYYSLANGFLTGKYRTEDDLSNKARGKRVQKYWNERGMRIIDAVREVAKTQATTPARVSLAWLLARDSVTAPIVSATSLEQLHDILGAVQLTLDSESLGRLTEASAWS